MTGGVSNPYGNFLLLPGTIANPGANILIGAGATIKTAPTGSISVTSPYIDIAGSLNSPSGMITVASSQRARRGDSHAGIVCLDFR